MRVRTSRRAVALVAMSCLLLSVPAAQARDKRGSQQSDRPGISLVARVLNSVRYLVASLTGESGSNLTLGESGSNVLGESGSNYKLMSDGESGSNLR